GKHVEGLFDIDTWNVTAIEGDGDELEIASLNPLDGGTIEVGENLRVAFNQLISIGSGEVQFLKKSDLSELATLDVSGSAVSVSLNQLTITPPLSLPLDEVLIVQFSEGALNDPSGNSIGELFDNDTWNFTLKETDNTSPKISSYIPESGGVIFDRESTITVEFDQPIVKGVGVVKFSNSFGTVTEINIGSSLVKIDGNALTIRLDNKLSYDVGYSVTMSESAITDVSGNPIGDLFDLTPWDFALTDGSAAPTIVKFTPQDGGFIFPGSDIFIHFSENVRIFDGIVRIYRKRDMFLLDEIVVR
ncbi:Ig-like domain-containing protein, partial [Roseivirga sp.]|uniref:Ig-like domain-containing protein n=1 Tax=Roseivirga sp. TaxID=1964215 RepID=UPI003B8C0153